MVPKLMLLPEICVTEAPGAPRTERDGKGGGRRKESKSLVGDDLLKLRGFVEYRQPYFEDFLVEFIRKSSARRDG